MGTLSTQEKVISFASIELATALAQFPNAYNISYKFAKKALKIDSQKLGMVVIFL